MIELLTEKNMRNKQNLGQKWKNFLNIILSPGSIIFLLIALFSLFMSISRPESEKLLSDVFAVFASISTAGAGIFIKDDWEKMRGKSLVEEKGRSAIRNLESIGRQILQIRNWIKVFVSQKKNEKRDLEEINRHLSVTERNIVSGIADWTDIIPELQEKKRAEQDYQKVMKSYVHELFESKKKLLETRGSKKIKEQLEIRIKDLEKNVKDLKKYQPGFTNECITNMDDRIAFPTISVNSGVFDGATGTKICSRCGKEYKDDLASGALASFYNQSYCPECRDS